MEVGERIAGATTRPIAAGDEVRELPPSDVDPTTILEAVVTTEAYGDSTVGEILRRWESHELVVVHRGRLVLDWLAPGAEAAQRHRCYSVTKSFTGTLAAMAMAEGRLDRSARVGDLVEELADSGFARATVGQVADMTVAVGYDENYLDADEGPRHGAQRGFGDYMIALGLDPGPDATDLDGHGTTGAEDDAPPARSIRTFLPTIGGAIDGRDHGAAFAYGTPFTDVLAWLLDGASGVESYPELLEAVLWSRIGAEHDAVLSFDPAGTPVCGGGLAVTTRDLARFGLVLAEGGRRGDDQIVPTEVIETIRSGGDPDVFQAGGTYGYLAGYSYRDQWWMPGGSHRPLSAWGIHGQLLWVDPDADLVVACHSGGPDPDNQRRDLEHDALCRTLAAASPNWR